MFSGVLNSKNWVVEGSGAGFFETEVPERVDGAGEGVSPEIGRGFSGMIGRFTRRGFRVFVNDWVGEGKTGVVKICGFVGVSGCRV